MLYHKNKQYSFPTRFRNKGGNMGKILTIIVNASCFSEAMNELKKEESNIFLDIDKKLIGNNRAEGFIEKDRSNIEYVFYDEADL